MAYPGHRCRQGDAVRLLQPLLRASSNQPEWLRQVSRPSAIRALSRRD